MAALNTRLGTVSEIVYELLDALGGWSTAGIGSNYGDGFELSQKLVLFANLRLTDGNTDPAQWD